MKKRIYILACLAMQIIMCSAQQYLPILSDNKMWNVTKRNVWTEIGMGEDIPYTISVHGDTIVDGHNCRKLYFESKNSNYYKAGFEEGEQLYIYFAGYPDEEPTLAIDMSVHKGDVLATGLEIIKEDTVCINGINRKRLTIGNEGDCWVEGIGPNSSYIWASPVESVLSEYWTFESCFENGNCIFSKEDFLSSPIVSIQSTQICQQQNNEIYDLSGKKVVAPIKRNIYINNGKKIIYP